MGELKYGAIVGRGKYRLERVLGEGGMGVVWLAREVADPSKRHAIKFITGTKAQAPSFQKRFHREARAAMAVRHPNVVRIHEVLEDDDGELMLVMEFLVGMSLGARLDKHGRLSPSEMVSVMLPVVSAVGAAHAAGIVHRDLKPDNIFLVQEPDGRFDVRVLDFGVAKLPTLESHDGQSAGLTMTGSMLGTPAYMSPEQATGEKNVDAQTDVWSIGVLIFECLTGQLPVVGENIGQLIKAIVTGRVKRLETVAPQLPPPLIDIVNRCLQVERSERPQDLREVFDVLRALPGSSRMPWVANGVVASVPPAKVRDFESAPTLSSPPRAEALSGLENADAPPGPNSTIGTTTTAVGGGRRSFGTGVLLGIVTISAAAVTLLFAGSRLVRAPPAKDPSAAVTIASAGSASLTPPEASAAVVPSSSSIAMSPTSATTVASSSAASVALDRPKSTGARPQTRSSSTVVPAPARDAGPAKLQGGVAGEVPF